MNREDIDEYGLHEPTRIDERHDDTTVNIGMLLAFIEEERTEWIDLDGCIAGIRGFLAGIRARR